MNNKVRKEIAEKIEAELNRKSALGLNDLKQSIENGLWDEAADFLLFFAPAAGWDETLGHLLEWLDSSLEGARPEIRMSMLNFLVRLFLDLGSRLRGWHLADRLSPDTLDGAQARVGELIDSRSGTPEDARLATELREEERLRLLAEGVGDDEAVRRAEELCGETLGACCRGLEAEYRIGNLTHIAEEFRNGASRTMLGNDYADFTGYTMRKGFCFQTTNPPLIQMAWETKPDFWRRQLERTLSATREVPSGPEEAVMLMTMEVVGYNCRRLRPLFLLSRGRLGYVCYQVNPNNHHAAEAMAAEAEEVYRRFSARMDGVPNVSFKLPGTSAGLEAAARLTAAGLSVTVTLSFALFQTTEFAKVLQQGNALFNAVVVMNGRLAFPVRDELLALDRPNGEAASRLAGVEVTRQVYRLLYRSTAEGGLGIDPEKVRIMNASLRIYGDDIPDLDQIWGTPAITVFPNVRRAYDLVEREFKRATVTASTAGEKMHELQVSEIFRQAWWIPGEDPGLKPDNPISLKPEDAKQVVDWEPIRETLTQFIAAYAKTKAAAESIFKQ